MIELSELSYLVDMLVNPPKDIEELKQRLATRIKYVETLLTAKPVIYNGTNAPPPMQIYNAPPPMQIYQQQAPSTLAAMDRHAGVLQATGVLLERPVTPVVLTGNEMQARENSMEILKKRKQQQLKV